MADSLAVTFRAIIKSTMIDDLDLGDPKDSLDWSRSQAFTTGTGTNQADLLFHDSRTLAQGANEDIDLDSVLVPPVGGGTFDAAEIVGFGIKNLATVAGDYITVGGAVANPFINWVSAATDEVVVGPSGVILIWSPIDGYAVTAATGDLLNVANGSGANAITYEIVIVGRSA